MKDPVCGMEVAPERAAGSLAHDGTTWYFCSAGCLAKFTAHPGQYVAKSAPAEPAAAHNH